ncbi:MAG: hypothetical protein ACLU97_02530 [Dorea sp.]|mgnify:CR=1 FL=1
MYIGLNSEEGKRIPDREAFSYACERCFYGGQEEQSVFMELAKRCMDIEEFVEELVEWYYSGNWLYDASDNKKAGWIIRFSDKSLRAFYGTYKDAVVSAREEAAPKGLGFEVV